MLFVKTSKEADTFNHISFLDIYYNHFLITTFLVATPAIWSGNFLQLSVTNIYGISSTT